MLSPLAQRLHPPLSAVDAHSTPTEALVALLVKVKVEFPEVAAAAGPLKSWTSQLGRAKDFAPQFAFACALTSVAASAAPRTVANILRLDAVGQPTTIGP